MSDDYNPFLSSDDEGKHEDGVVNGSAQAAVLSSQTNVQDQSEYQVMAEDKSLQKYTSLDEHVTTMLRSVSIEEDPDRFSPLIRSNESGNVKDLSVKVDKPEKHVEGYVSYNVSTKTTRGQYEEPEYNVRRRYQDFLWLRQKLEESYPTHVIPPLPEKFSFTKHFDRFDPDFLRTRQKALDKFVNRVVDHPVMSFSDHLQTFLTAKAWEMVTARKQAPNIVNKMGGSMKSVATSLMLKNKDQEFEELSTYTRNLQQKIQKFGQIAEEIAKERFYLLDDMAEYGSGFRLWSNSESRLSVYLSAMAYALDKNIEALKALLRVQDSRVSEPIREYNLYCEAVKTALKKRDQIQVEYEITTEELNKKRSEKQEVEQGPPGRSLATLLGKDPDKVREEKLERLSQQIKELITETEVLEDRRERADHDMKADMERWHKTKRRDLKGLLLEISDRHVKYYESSLNAWQDALDAFNGPHTKEKTDE